MRNPLLLLRLRWQLLLGCMVPVLLMLADALASRRALDESLATSGWTVHTNEVIGAANALMKTVVDAETGERGYLLTKDPRFLEPYDAAVSSFWKKLADGEHLAADEPAQLAHLKELEVTFQEWRREVAIPAIRAVAFDAERERNGKVQVDRLRAIVDRFVETERALLEERTAASDRVVERSRLLATLSAALSILIAIAIAAYLSTSIGRAVEELASAARGLAEGDTTRRVRVDRRDEVGALATSFNRMAQRLTARGREMELLGGLGEELQACLDLDEARDAFVRFVKVRLGDAGAGHPIKDSSGAVFMTNASRDLILRRFQWGSGAISETVSPESCWALRKGHAHHVEGNSGPRCQHLTPPDAESSLCVPLVAHAETIGILHVVSGPGTFDDERLAFISRVAEVLGQALASLQLQEKLRAQAIRDPLTGLFNRRYLEETLPRELSRCGRAEQPLALLALDVDHFKRFNDTFGHEAGDVVLREMAGVIRAMFRESDLGARMGGEEFVVVLPGIETAQIAARAEALREAVKRLALSHRGIALGAVTVSIGVAVFPDSGREPAELMRAADAALYRAKAAGRDRVVFAEVESGAPPQPSVN